MRGGRVRTAGHTLADLVDLERLQRMCASFAAAGDIGLAALRQEQKSEALRDSEIKYHDVVERANDGIAILQGGLVLFANEALARMSGYSADELTGLGLLTLAQEPQHAQITELMRRRLAGAQVPSTYEIDLVRKDGRASPPPAGRTPGPATVQCVAGTRADGGA